MKLEARKAVLQSRLDAPEMPELLHPRMADVYREKVRTSALRLRARRAAGRARGHPSAARSDPARARWRAPKDHAEGRPGGDAERSQRHEEVARDRRPHGPNKVGCGGPQPTLSAAVAPCSLKVRQQYAAAALWLAALATISATGCSWAWRPAKGHENRRLGRMAALGAARSRLAMEQLRPSNCLTRSVRD